MNHAALKNLILQHAEAAALANEQRWSAAAEWLNQPTIPVRREYRVSWLTVLDRFGIVRGSAILSALQAAQTVVYACMDPARGGVNIAHADAEPVLNQLAAAGAITHEERQMILDLATVYVGAALETCGANATADDCEEAWRNN